MSNRAHALHAFQQQLSQRLQQANRATATARACIAVVTGERRWLFELVHTAEMLSLAGVTPVPFTRHWYLGLINHRSQLTSVIDLEAFADAADATSNAAHAGSNAAMSLALPPAADRLLVLSPSLPLRCAIRITQVIGIVDRDRFRAGSRDTTQPAWCQSSFRDAKDLRWNLVDLPALMNTSAFLDISRC